MNDFIVNALNVTLYVTAVLVIIISCLVILCLLLYPIWYLLNKVMYPRVKASYLFLKYIRNRKEFEKWFKETEPDVHHSKVNKRV